MHTYVNSIFLHICRQYYAGINTKDISGRADNKVCKKLSSIRQIYYEKGKETRNSPYERFEEFICIDYTLPDKTASRNISLFTSFF